MSTTSNGQFILCDGDGCQAHMRKPIGLQQAFAGDDGGWLYVARSGRQAHYCTVCRNMYIAMLKDDSPAAADSNAQLSDPSD